VHTDDSTSIADGLTERFADSRILTDPEDRRSRARDWWALARLRESRGDDLAIPAAVVLPRASQEAANILAWANARAIPVVPRGLGSGVCGAVVPARDALVMDLSGMDAILSLDEISQVVHVQAGIRGDVLERYLNERGLTLGHYPQSMAISTVGGWIASSSAGQASAGYGSIEDHLVGLTVALPDGSLVHVRPRPRSAVGPDLRRLFVGAEGTLGVVTEAHLACAPLDPEVTWLAHLYPDFGGVLAAAREIKRAGVDPRISRGWDEPDTVSNFGTSHGLTSGAVGLVGLASSAPGLLDRLDAVGRIATRHGGAELDPSVGRAWWDHRLDAVGLFERIMGPERLLGPGGVIDTLEVSGLWSVLPAVHGAVNQALEPWCSEVRCHFSHVYPSGAALYFSFIINEPDEDAAEVAYLAAWRDALGACQGAGGSVAHHHGIGKVKASALEGDIGADAMALLRRIKDAIDPVGILNPTTLFPSVSSNPVDRS